MQRFNLMDFFINTMIIFDIILLEQDYSTLFFLQVEKNIKLALL